MRISDWSSDVCSSDLRKVAAVATCTASRTGRERNAARADARSVNRGEARHAAADTILPHLCAAVPPTGPAFRQITRFCLARRLCARARLATRNRLISAPVMSKSAEQPSELQPLMPTAYAALILSTQRHLSHVLSTKT